MHTIHAITLLLIDYNCSGSLFVCYLTLLTFCYDGVGERVCRGMQAIIKVYVNFYNYMCVWNSKTQ